MAGADGAHRAALVSPEFILRPSLSGCAIEAVRDETRGVAGVYTPAFVERARKPSPASTSPGCVAGVYTPAFVERWSMAAWARWSGSSVAGVYTPAFVERSQSETLPRMRRAVSPEFILRPSLSGERGQDGGEYPDVSPEFILRPSLSGVLDAVREALCGCRRSLYSGLR